MGGTSIQAIWLWSQSKSGLTGSDQLLKEEFTGQASTRKNKSISSNGWGSPNQGKREMKNPSTGIKMKNKRRLVAKGN